MNTVIPSPSPYAQDLDVESLDSHDIFGSSPSVQIRSPTPEMGDERVADQEFEDLFGPLSPPGVAVDSPHHSDGEMGSDPDSDEQQTVDSPHHCDDEMGSDPDSDVQQTGGSPEEADEIPSSSFRTDDRQSSVSTPSMPRAQPQGIHFSSCLDDVPLQVQLHRLKSYSKMTSNSLSCLGLIAGTGGHAFEGALLCIA